MVCVADVFMRVDERIVAVFVRVRRTEVDSRRVLVAMVQIVDMHVLVLGRFVDVHMQVPVAEEQDHASAHQPRGRELPTRQRVAEEHDRDEHARERSGREHGGLTCRTQSTQRVRVEQNTHAVADRTQCERGQDQLEHRAGVDRGGAPRPG